MFDLEPYFDIALSIPDGIKKLREMILTLAMQGKLVPQDPNDQPASELLKEIEAEKKRLLKQGKLKKSKPLAPITKEEIPYDIPDSWQWTRLDNFCLDAFSGKSPVYSKIKTEYKIIGQATNQQWGLDFSKVKYTNIDFWRNMECKYFLQNLDVILNTLGNGTLGRSGIIQNLEEPLLTDGHLFVFRNINSVASYFFYYYLQANRSFIERMANGSTNQVFLNLSKCKNWPIPLPPLAEQKRIVAKIEQLMARCDGLEQLKADRDKTLQEMQSAAVKRLLDASTCREAWQFLHANFSALCSIKENIAELRKAILQLAVMGKLVPQDPNDQPASELLEKIEAEKKHLIKNRKIKKSKPLAPILKDEIPYRIPESWQWVRLGSMSESIVYGTSQKTCDDLSLVPVYRMGNIREGILLHDNMKFISPNIKDLPALYLCNGDILFNRTNSYELVGKSALYQGNDNYATYASYLIRVRLILRNFSPAYIIKAMNSTYFRQTQIEPSIVQQCGQANFNGTKLANCLIPLPPLVEQQRIISKVESLMKLCDELDCLLEDHQTVSNSVIDEMVKQATFVSKFTTKLLRSAQTILDNAFDALVETQGKYTVSQIENDLRTVWNTGYQELKPIFIDMAKRDDKYKYIAVRYMETSNSSVGVVSEFQRPLAQHYGIKKFSNLSMEEDRRRFWELFRKKYCD